MATIGKDMSQPSWKAGSSIAGANIRGMKQDENQKEPDMQETSSAAAFIRGGSSHQSV
jgi:hypothetical protein